MATKDTGKVNIRGKEYETVASRVARFREEYSETFSITTEIVSVDESVVIMKATISDKDQRVIATGHAEEQRASSQINRTSALENAETSAIGRALAAFGMAGTEFASADEVAQAISQRTPAEAGRDFLKKTGSSKPAETKTYPPSNKTISDAQIKLLMKMAAEASGFDDKESVVGWFVTNIGQVPNKVLMDDMEAVMAQIRMAKEAA